MHKFRCMLQFTFDLNLILISTECKSFSPSDWRSIDWVICLTQRIDRFFLTAWLFERTSIWSSYWLIEWLYEWLIDSVEFSEWLSDCLTDRMIAYVIDNGDWTEWSAIFFRLKSYAGRSFDLKSQVWFQTKIARPEVQLPLWFWNRTV